MALAPRAREGAVLQIDLGRANQVVGQSAEGVVVERVDAQQGVAWKHGAQLEALVEVGGGHVGQVLLAPADRDASQADAEVRVGRRAVHRVERHQVDPAQHVETHHHLARRPQRHERVFRHDGDAAEPSSSSSS